MTSASNHFQLLGLAPGFFVDEADLERRFHERSRVHHPDRHAKSDGATRVKSALATAELNLAYRTLRDPIRRAEYLLKLSGIEISDEKGGPKPSPAFLMEILELREALADAKAAHDDAAIDRLAADVRARRDATRSKMEGCFANGAGRGGASPAPAVRDVAGAAEGLVALRYFQRFLDEIEAIDDERAARASAAPGRP